MIGRRTSLILVALFLFLLFAAWFDGGEEPLQPIEQPVELPHASSGGAL